MDFQYYPTPIALAHRAWKKFNNTAFRRVLDPSGGTGELAVAVKDLFRSRQIKIDCCEIDVKHHPTLKSKGINVVGLDFMEFNFGSVYSHIILNPPFLHGAKHLLRAWDILWNGEIVAILNAETIKNPFGHERQQLLRLISEHGTVEFIENAFNNSEAERQTTVEIALIHLTKVANVKEEIIGDLLGELKQDRGIDSAGYKEEFFPAVPNSAIENAVAVFGAAVSTMKNSVIAEAKASYYSRLLQDTANILTDGQTKQPITDGTDWVQAQIDTRYDDIRESAWKLILSSTNVASKLSNNAYSELLAQFAAISKLEFSVSNIYGFLCGLIDRQHDIQQGMLCEVFDLFSRYHSDNVHFYKGWKSNDRHRTCGRRIKSTRLIIPGNSVASYSSSISYGTRNMLQNIDRVFAYLDGKANPELGLVTLFDVHFSQLRHGSRVSSSYFDIRFYPVAGTIHFFPRNKALIERLNRFVGACRHWIPKDEKSVKQDFWTQFERAEKFDADFRKEFAKASGQTRFMRNSLANVGLAATAEHLVEANQLASDVMQAVLSNAGIDTEFQIAEASPTRKDQLCLEM